MSIVPRFTGDRCPTCGTEFSTSMHPFDVAFREEQRKRRSKAAKKGWKKRKRNGASFTIGKGMLHPFGAAGSQFQGS
jgi:hypothetical protein